MTATHQSHSSHSSTRNCPRRVHRRGLLGKRGASSLTVGAVTVAAAVALPVALPSDAASSGTATAQEAPQSSAQPDFRGEVTGGAALVQETKDALEPGYRHNMAVAKIDGDNVTFGGVGADENTEFEIGSITKTFTAGLFADSIERREVAPSTTLGEVWPDLDGKVADITLESLATQRSGLPRLPPAPEDPVDQASYVASLSSPQDPYPWSDEEIVESLHSTPVGEQEPEYSNYGFAVLGQALSTVTGQSYADLVRDRITEPLGLDDTYVPESAEGLSHGWIAPGIPSDPWTLQGSASAGAIRSTAEDISTWIRAVRDGEAPGSDAKTPREPYDEGESIGWAWITEHGQDSDVTWHNGVTGGFASFAGFNTGSGEGVVVLSDTATTVDSATSLIS